MTNDMQISIDWTDDKYGGEVVDTKQIAMIKQIHELTIDEAIQYRAGDFFPKNSMGNDDIKRNNQLRIRVDAKFRRALKIISYIHHHMTKSDNRFIAVALGSKIIMNEYRSEILTINNRYAEVNSGIDDDLFARIDCHIPIQQDGATQEARIGFAQWEFDLFIDMSEDLGLSSCALAVYCFWFAAITCGNLPDHILEYGEKMKLKFEKHLKSRIYDLQYGY